MGEAMLKMGVMVYSKEDSQFIGPFQPLFFVGLMASFPLSSFLLL